MSLQRIRASWVLPIEAPPIRNGEVIIEEGRIVKVREAKGAADSFTRDLGEAVILPGLVNVHTHLDYTVMRGLLEDLEFFPWIRTLTERAARLEPEEWRASAVMGAAEAVMGGVTTLADCSPTGEAAEGAKALGLGGIVYREVFGIDEAQTVEAIVEQLNGRVEQLKKVCAGTRLKAGVSPHSPYTVRPALFRAVAEYAERECLPLCIHAAESQAEAALVRSGTGPIAERLKERGIDWQPSGGSVAAYLHKLGALGPRTLLVHGVQISAEDRLLTYQSQSAWAHCPKSNAKLGNGTAPLDILGSRHFPKNEAGFQVKIGIGSDSVASNNTMDMFEEMRFAVLMQRGTARRIAALTAPEALNMATLGGARALGLEDEIGSLGPGKHADLCAVRLDRLPLLPSYDPVSVLVYAAGARDVCFTMANGRVLYDVSLDTDPFCCFPEVPVRAELPIFLQAAERLRA